jgi:formiminoglutamase
MIFNYLQSVDQQMIDFASSQRDGAIGRNIQFISDEDTLMSSDVKLALVFVPEFRGDNNYSSFETSIDLDPVRKEFYRLYISEWNFEFSDLGTVILGNSLSDTYKAIEEIANTLIKRSILPVFIGGSHDLTYANYRAYDSLEQTVNLVSVDPKFDLGTLNESLNSNSFLSHIILGQPNNLFNFTNLGFQTYFNSKEEIQLMDKLYFDTVRIGNINNDTSIVEPILRDADILSFDLSSIRSSDFKACSELLPNGLYGEQACAITRYGGVSDKITSFGIYNYDSSLDKDQQGAKLISQMLWYFFEGFSLRANDYPYTSKEEYVKYIVPLEDDELYFYKSHKTDRWWLDVPYPDGKSDSIVRHALIPCSYNDYIKATEQEIPDRYWKAYRKLL